jgi:arylsulfatase A-like enzyme
MAQILGKAGYATAHFGKWHLGPVKSGSPTSPGAMGFDEWLSHDNFFELDPVLSRNGGEPQKIEGESSQIVIDEAIKFIQKSNTNKKPFLVLVWFGSPHEPYSGLPDDLALYDGLPEELNDQTVHLTSNETGQRTERLLRDVLRERYAEITAMDRSIGVLRTYLKEAGLSENTLLWYCGDNGTPPSAARTGLTVRGQKGTVYEGGILVPGVIEWPAMISKPLTSGAPSVTSDMLPTLCDYVGVPLPERPLDGISIRKVIEGTMDIRKDPIFFWQFETGTLGENLSPYIEPQLQEGTTPLAKMMAGKYTRTFRNFHYPAISEDHFQGARVMMSDRYKLVVDGDRGEEPSVELFDLKSDRSEELNIADFNPEIADQMQQQMREWQQSVLESLTGADYN